MTIKKLSSDKVRITLNQEELAAFDIEWDRFGPDDEPTRASAAAPGQRWESTGFCPEDGQLYIEALPNTEGCVLILSKSHENDSDKSLCAPVVFQFRQIQDLLSGAKQLFHHYSHRILHSSLYRCADGCLLLICPLDQISQESALLLAEYGTLLALWRTGKRHNSGALHSTDTQ